MRDRAACQRSRRARRNLHKTVLLVRGPRRRRACVYLFFFGPFVFFVCVFLHCVCQRRVAHRELRRYKVNIPAHRREHIINNRNVIAVSRICNNMEERKISQTHTHRRTWSAARALVMINLYDLIFWRSHWSWPAGVAHSQRSDVHAGLACMSRRARAHTPIG